MKISWKKEIKDSQKITEQEIIDLILKNREIKDEKEFLEPKDPQLISLQDFHKSYKSQFKKVIKILEEIKKNNQTVVVYTDYDADGITGGAILWETLHLLGFKVMPYVPDRKQEGYGFSKKGIDNIKQLYDPTLIISVDHGITKVKEVKYATSLGIQVIITDHHLKQKDIPKKAKAIFHIPALSGSGVAYFFAKEIFQNFKFKISNLKLLEQYFSSDYLALASIGTIADMVPLIGPSRSIVKFGLETFSKVKRFGIRHILKEAGIEDKPIAPYDIGFIIAPRINAVGRLESAIDALRLLCTTNEDRAQKLAHKVGQTNKNRQDLVEKAVEEAKEQFKVQSAKCKVLPKIIILTSDHWHEGIIGLIASKIVEKYYRPTIVLTKNDGFYKASARSIPIFHITDFLVSLKKYLVDVGGHKQAAGFTIEKDKLSEFIKAAEKKADKLISKKDLEKKIEVDLNMPLSKITLSLAKKIESLAPFGIGNPQPTFYSQGEIVNAQLFGKQNNHLKIWLKDHALEFIGFFQADKFKSLSRGKIIEIVYTLDINRWGGKESLRGKINSIISV